MTLDPIAAQTRAIQLQTIALAIAAVFGPVVAVVMAAWMQKKSEERQRKFQMEFYEKTENSRRAYENGNDNNDRAYQEKREHLRQQYEASITKKRFKIDLFDKRFAVFRATQEYINHVIVLNSTNSQNASTWIQQFDNEARASIFLFDKPLSDYLNNLWARGHRAMVVYNLKNDPNAVGPEVTKQYNETKEMQLRMFDELIDLPEKFSPYLKFSDWEI